MLIKSHVPSFKCSKIGFKLSLMSHSIKVMEDILMDRVRQIKHFRPDRLYLLQVVQTISERAL